jgi:outer membrane receptor protein involved in Fe transport
MSAVSKTSTNGYTLVNLGFGGKVTLGKKNIFNVNLNGNNLFDKRYTLLIYPDLKMMEFRT